MRTVVRRIPLDHSEIEGMKFPPFSVEHSDTLYPDGNSTDTQRKHSWVKSGELSLL